MEADFYTEQTKGAVINAVSAVELRTAAEVVVTLRNKAGEYRQADYACGALAAFFTLLVLLFYPRSFSTLAMPFDVLAVFAISSLACANSPPLRRLFTTRHYRERQVSTAARAAFVELGTSRTRNRTGILIFVSMLEREVAIVADIGVDTRALGRNWLAAVAALEESVANGNASAFVFALGAMAAPLEALLPRGEDDADELDNTPTFS